MGEEFFDDYTLSFTGRQTADSFEAELTKDNDLNTFRYLIQKPPLGGIFSLEGTFGEDSDYKTDDNKDGKFVTLLMFTKDEKMTCTPKPIYFQGTKKGGDDNNDDKNDNMAVCTKASDKKTCKKAAKKYDWDCTFIGKKKGACVFLNEKAPAEDVRPCYDEDYPNWTVKGKSTKFKEKNNKNGAYQATCECFTSVKSMSPGQDTNKEEVKVGEMTPGFIRAFVNE